MTGYIDIEIAVFKNLVNKAVFGLLLIPYLHRELINGVAYSTLSVATNSYEYFLVMNKNWLVDLTVEKEKN